MIRRPPLSTLTYTLLPYPPLFRSRGHAVHRRTRNQSNGKHAVHVTRLMLTARFIMTEYRSDLLRLLSTRGYIHQLTDASGLDALAAQSTVPGYIGFDPTAPSLHVGSLVQIMLLRRLQHAGHQPIVQIVRAPCGERGCQ